ncbi:hypothetical protein EJ110_NYTH59398 [Nymphaea thermarum]|nr:hypothetical protein EJ110_NYTH59398 [Nymphaea thermarum]
MATDIDVSGSIAGVQLPEDGNRVSSQRVKIGFFLKDTLKVIDENGEVTKSQCCCEQKTITIYSSQVNDLDRIKQLAYRTLHDDMDMNAEAAEEAKSEVATTIRDKVVPARDSYPPLSTILLEIRVGCTIEKRDEQAGDPSGEHGYDRLLERLYEDDCGICHREFDSDDHIVVTTCQHTFHRSCLFQLLYRGIFPCRMCGSDLAPIFGVPIRF